MGLDLNHLLKEHLDCIDGVRALEGEINAVAEQIQAVIGAGGTVYVCGNGGSASDAQHFASELTGRFEKNRPGYAAFALTTDTSALTAIGNDYGFDRIFARQLESVGRTGDCLLVISTSGGSANLLEAVKSAKAKSIITIGLLGRDGGELGRMVDFPIIVPGERTSRIQESHIFILHCLCEPLEG